MNIRFYLSIIIFSILFSVSPQLYAQCDINFDVPSVGGIYPDTLFDAQGCEFYEENITFFLPRDTTVEIVPGQPFTIPFNTFTIVDVTGLPEGMEWICNKDTAGCVYNVSPNNPTPDTLGCVRFFGTPETPGFYPIAVEIVANLQGLGDQPAQFDITLTVTPCIINSDCYTFELSDICTPSTLGLNNNVSSNGNDGVSYVWEIAGPNGFEFRSENENPSDQVLDEGGTYVIAYEAKIDTVGTIIKQAIIESVNCRDLLDAGDIYWVLKDTLGNEFINTSSSPLNNAGNDTPIITNIADTVLPDGVYEFQVWDSDNIIGDRTDDGCADRNDESSVFFTIPLPDSLMSGDTLKLTNMGLSVSFLFERPVSFFSCSDTFTLAATPAMPEIAFDGDLNICENDTLVLEVAASDSLQWFKDGEALEFGVANRLLVTEPGVYAVSAINVNSLCFSTSEEIEVTQTILQAPEIEFTREDSLLSIVSPNPDYVYQWILEGEGSVGEGTNLEIESSGTFSAILVDPASGCVSPASESLNAIVLDREKLLVQDWNVYPNPTNGALNFELNLFQPQSISLRVSDLYGRRLLERNLGTQQRVEEKLSLTHLSKGVYVIQINVGEQILFKKIVLQ